MFNFTSFNPIRPKPVKRSEPRLLIGRIRMNLNKTALELIPAEIKWNGNCIALAFDANARVIGIKPSKPSDEFAITLKARQDGAMNIKGSLYFLETFNISLGIGEFLKIPIEWNDEYKMLIAKLPE